MESQTPIIFKEDSLHTPNRWIDFSLRTNPTSDSNDRINLSTYSWSVNSSGLPKKSRALIILHGFGEYGGRYAQNVEKFQRTFDSVRTYDQRGHGTSPGLRGHFSSLRYLSNDFWLFYARCLVDDILAEVSRDYVVLGHSFGGLVLLNALEDPMQRVRILDYLKASNFLGFCKNKADGSLDRSNQKRVESILTSPDFLDRYHSPMNLVFSAPLLGVKVQAPLWKKGLGRVLSKFGATSALQLTNEINATQLSHDSANADRYTSDKLIHHNITPLAYSEMLRAIDNCAQRTAASWGIPKHSKILVLIPTADSIVDSAAGKSFFTPLITAASGSDTRCKIIQYDGLYHEIFNELDQSPYSDLHTWVEQLN